MPSAASLLQMVNNQPSVVYNPGYNGGGGQGSRYNYRYPQAPQEGIDSKIAKSMLTRGKVSEAQAQHLQNIISTNGTQEDQDRYRKAEEAQRAAILKAGTDPNNPLTVDEFQSALTEHEQQFGVMQGFPKPQQLYSAAAREQDPLLDQAMLTETFSNMFEMDPEQVGAFIAPGGKNGIDQEARNKMFELLSEREERLYQRKNPTASASGKVKSPVDTLEPANRVYYDAQSTFLTSKLEGLGKGAPVPPEGGRTPEWVKNELQPWQEEVNSTRLELLKLNEQIFGTPDHLKKPEAGVGPAYVPSAPADGSMPLSAPTVIPQARPLSQLEPVVEFTDKLSPKGDQMAVVSDGDSYNTLLVSGKLHPGDYFVDDQGTLALVGPDGTPKPVR